MGSLSDSVFLESLESLVDSGRVRPAEMEALFTEVVNSNETVTTAPWVMYVGFNEWAAEYWVYYLIPYAKRFGVLNDVHTKIRDELTKRGIQ
ncbi:hypothetical protein TI05_14400, partial [Achromatium sp. WMS3]